MKDYFDHTFFRFLFGFIAILFVSLLLLLGLRVHATHEADQVIPVSVSFDNGQ